MNAEPQAEPTVRQELDRLLDPIQGFDCQVEFLGHEATLELFVVSATFKVTERVFEVKVPVTEANLASILTLFEPSKVVQFTAGQRKLTISASRVDVTVHANAGREVVAAVFAFKDFSVREEFPRSTIQWI